MKFTAREIKVGTLVAQGLKNDEIATEIGSTRCAIKNNVVSILDKTGMNSRLELALWWMEHGKDCPK